MIQIATYTVLFVLAAIAIFCAVGAVSAVNRVLNQKAAWKYRESIARLTYHIESEGSGASPVLREFAGWVASLVFRSDIFEMITRKVEAGESASANEKDFEAQFADDNERKIAHTLIDLLATICMLNDVRVGRSFRALMRMMRREERQRDMKLACEKMIESVAAGSAVGRRFAAQ